MGPLFDLGWRDRLHKVGGSGGHICPYCFHNQAAIPGGMKLALAFADYGYVVAAPVVFERDMKRLMDITNPMT